MAESHTSGAPHAYGQAGVRVAYAVADGVEIGIGLDALLLVATKTARWDSAANDFRATCPSPAPTGCNSELASFQAETLQSKQLLSAGLGIGARYAF